MTNKDKVIAAFLISAGLFSSAQAMKYVGMLSAKDKKALLPVAADKSIQLLVASGAEIFTEEGKDPQTA